MIKRRFLAIFVAVGLLFGLTLPVGASAAPTKATVKVRANFAKSTYAVGDRPIVKVKVTAKRDGRAVPARGKVIVTALGKRERASVSRGKVKVKLSELTGAGTVVVRITFKGKALPKRTVTKRITVQQATWVVEDAEMRAQIRAALDLPDDHALTLTDAARLNNVNGAVLHFADVKTAAGLEIATNLTELTSFTAANAQDSRGLDNIVRVNGLFWISNAVQDASYPKLTYIGDALKAFNTAAERIRTISLPELVDVKSIEVDDRPQLATIALPKLATVRGDILVEDVPALTTLDLPSLATTVGLDVSESPRVQTLDLARLTTVNGNLRVVELPLLGGITAPALQQVAGDLALYGLGSITALRMPVLKFSHGAVLFGIGEDFPILPRDGSAVSFPAFDINQATGFDFSVKGATDQSTVLAERWQEFLAYFAAV